MIKGGKLNKSKIERYPIGSICYRCGVDYKEARKHKISCSAYGSHYEKHLWNDRVLRIRTYTIVL